MNHGQADAYFKLGNLQTKLGNNQAAIADYQKAIVLDSGQSQQEAFLTATLSIQRLFGSL
jgi:tetratricopeptide (TPR) repeat protein